MTTNGYLDRSPKIAGPTENSVALVWISNENNDIQGSASKPNTLWLSRWNGTTWSTPERLATIPFYIVKYALAYDGSAGYVVLSVDTDHNPMSVEDRELYLISFGAGMPNKLTRLTNDDVVDSNPQLTVDSQGDILLVWVRGDEISSVVNFAMDERRVIATVGYSTNVADFKLTATSDDTIALVWAEASSSSGSDIKLVVYDPVLSVWGRPKQLTFDEETEKYLTAAFYGSRALIAVYNRSKLGPPQESSQVLEGQGNPPGPIPEATDLYMLRHTFGGDLALERNTLVPSPGNPRPGETVTLKVRVINQGDVAVKGVAVAFYQGDPSTRGIQIGSATIPDTLAPGERSEAMVNWTVPPTQTPLEIFAVVDPEQLFQDSDRTNNIAGIRISKPDLTIQTIRLEPITEKVVSITARVANQGSLPSGPTTVTLRRQSSTGSTLLASRPISALNPDRSLDVNFQLDTTSLPSSQLLVYVRVDEANLVDEYDETNNEKTLLIQAGQACTYSISPSSALFAASGGSGSVSVKAPSGCAWQAVSNDSWITITSGSTGSGNGTVNYSVAANASTSQRTGTMTIAGQTFTVTQAGAPGGSAPTATTGSATNVTSNSATLKATVNPNGLATTVYFQWGTSPSYGNSTPSQSIGSGTSTVNVSANLSGLSPDTTYYYRIVATNSAGTTYGSGMSFRTDGSGLRAEFVKLQSGEITSISDAIALLNNPRSNPRVAFIHNGVVDFTDDEGAPYGFFPRQFRFEDIPILSGDPNNFAARFTGFIRIPAGPPPNTYTFAVGSDDGFRLTINDGTRDHVAEYAGLRAIGVGPLLQITFPPQGGLFPIDLVYFESGGGAILELSFARGAQNIFSTSTFTLVSPSMLSAVNSRAHIFYYPWYGNPRTDGR